MARRFGEDGQYYDANQFTLERRDDCWIVAPNVDATNETLMNGKAITEATPLSEGDVLAVGREAKGVAKLPLQVSFAEDG